MDTNNEARLPLATEYGDLVEAIKREVRGARLQAARVVNTELVRLYWRIGRLILDRGSEQGGDRTSSGNSQLTSGGSSRA